MNPLECRTSCSDQFPNLSKTTRIDFQLVINSRVWSTELQNVDIELSFNQRRDLPRLTAFQLALKWLTRCGVYGAIEWTPERLSHSIRMNSASVLITESTCQGNGRFSREFPRPTGNEAHRDDLLISVSSIHSGHCESNYSHSTLGQQWPIA